MSDERGIEPLGTGDESARPAEEPEIEIIAIGDDEIEAANAAGGEPPALDRDDPAAPAAGAAAAELAELRERHLRLRADFENYRKRMDREREERAKRALVEPLRELLPVVDNLERALVAPGSIDDLRHGVGMIVRQFTDTLRRFGVEEIAAVGLPFDPQFHEAVAREERADVEVPTVIAELQKGFLLHDRLLRPSMVRVAVPIESVRSAPSDEVATPDGTGGEAER